MMVISIASLFDPFEPEQEARARIKTQRMEKLALLGNIALYFSAKVVTSEKGKECKNSSNARS